MLIIGAKGLAKEVLEILHQLNRTDDLYFYDDVSADVPAKLYNIFPILTNTEQVKALFQKDNRFTLGIGNPIFRKEIFNRLKKMSLSNCTQRLLFVIQ